ncbi:hypothetical protein LJR234_000234 [Mesorhizobium amorphae]|uniref:hypothetical protein n=1 Tax=Mesorhizobium amorphae TaxID=71433 RepID=UPI003ED0A7CF
MMTFLLGSVIYAYTPELHPKRCRATGGGFASSIGRLGSLIGPYVVSSTCLLQVRVVLLLTAKPIVVPIVFLAIFGLSETAGVVIELGQNGEMVVLEDALLRHPNLESVECTVRLAGKRREVDIAAP